MVVLCTEAVYTPSLQLAVLQPDPPGGLLGLRLVLRRVLRREGLVQHGALRGQLVQRARVLGALRGQLVQRARERCDRSNLWG